MNKISTPIIISSIRSKVDGSLGFSASTPELSHEEKVSFMELQNLNLHALLTPDDIQAPDLKEIKGKLEGKTPSERLYNVIYVYWKQKGEVGNFQEFYARQMEKLINKVKGYLE